MAVYTTLLDPNTPASALASAGGKARNLLALLHEGFAIPRSVYIDESAYRTFVGRTGLERQLQGVLASNLQDLRWEEIWDVSLHIRNLFMRTPMPAAVAEPLLGALGPVFGQRALAVRSCSTQEDTLYSHAGLHDSVLDVRGRDGVLRAVRAVWASLWSDRAMMYRKELELSARDSAMGVIVQEMVAGDFSGVLFTTDPTDETRAVIEASSERADAVVSDEVEAERIFLSRDTGAVMRRLPGPDGAAPLPDAAVELLHQAGAAAEKALRGPQDMEWTLEPAPDGDGARLVVLQSRPITTLQARADAHSWSAEDKRPWYLSLTRSFRDMQHLHRRIVTDILPGMAAESAELRAADLGRLDCRELAAELTRRRERLQHWRDIYWGELIPFAHAVRLFGMLYNDALAPDDAYEFTHLLVGQELIALERNRSLDAMAAMIREDDALRAGLEAGELPEHGLFRDALEQFVDAHGDLACSTAWCHEGPWGVVRLLLRRAPDDGPAATPAKPQDADELEAAYLAAFDDEKRDFARAVLQLARESYRLRDDDNFYLGKIQARFEEIQEEARLRLADGLCADVLDPELVDAGQQARATMPKGYGWRRGQEGPSRIQTVQGWPASMGIGRGPARVVSGPDQLFDFQPGEVLVCDSLDPNMTFIAPMAAAIVERRGGMLVHGAIIAREYAIPCVTGIPDATERFQTGDRLVVDGFRGEVTIENPDNLPEGPKLRPKNVLGGKLQACSLRPMTGFYRTGECSTGDADAGSHVVCAVMTEEFLDYTRSRGNDLSTPNPSMSFPGLRPGDRWCVCALRWKEALDAGVAPPAVLEATHEGALRYVSLEELQQNAS